LLLVVSAFVVNGVALVAIAARISEFEFTPNRVARDSVVAVSDAREETLYRPQLCMYVPDVDALYARAVRAGAQPTFPPADYDYGGRSPASRMSGEFMVYGDTAVAEA
jgi:uncharacterized glyoxalase superfamily protein PhnB